jgi:hypothetical protein
MMSRPNTKKNHIDGLTLLPLDHGKLDIPVHHRHPRHSKEDSRHRHSARRVPVVPGNDQTALFGAFKRDKEKIERQHELNSTMTTMVFPIRICNVMILCPSAKPTTTRLVVAASSFGLYFCGGTTKPLFIPIVKGLGRFWVTVLHFSIWSVQYIHILENRIATQADICPAMCSKPGSQDRERYHRAQ